MPRSSPSWLFVVGACCVAAWVAPEFRRLHTADVIVPGPGVSEVRRLSDWFPPLAGGPGDTPVFVLGGPGGGGTALVLGGTHADEPAGYLTAVLLVERAHVERGRLIVIPRANASGFTHNVGQEAHPSTFVVDTGHGTRHFTFGARATNPVHQWPDPQVYTHSSGQALSGIETRNLNRAYPGRADGSLTERIAFAITTLIRREAVDVAIDLHEAAPEYPVVNTIVAHERAMEMAALANVNLQGQELDIGLEPSPQHLRGLSHREWGDATNALALLVETTNPAQGRLRGRTDGDLVTAGRDRFYVAAARRGMLSVPFDDAGWSLTRRVARHVATVGELLAVHAALSADRRVLVDGVPGYGDLIAHGLGRFLQPPPDREGLLP
ncbi:MAG: succinylglutamate desuccinylase/aspartoacylase family protein [Vicinamibacterales bacterium]